MAARITRVCATTAAQSIAAPKSTERNGLRLVFDQDGAQMLLAEDQHAMQYLAAQGADEAFADRIHPRRLDVSIQAWSGSPSSVV